mmetsp:Transcript_1480/g.4304  ORF Transcript_1480/g.4304 Transcript_1480/m.4304 type:complete len:218 (+) Transcript_1480:152-805(+)
MHHVPGERGAHERGRACGRARPVPGGPPQAAHAATPPTMGNGCVHRRLGPARRARAHGPREHPGGVGGGQAAAARLDPGVRTPILLRVDDAARPVLSRLWHRALGCLVQDHSLRSLRWGPRGARTSPLVCCRRPSLPPVCGAPPPRLSPLRAPRHVQSLQRAHVQVRAPTRRRPRSRALGVDEYAPAHGSALFGIGDAPVRAQAEGHGRRQEWRHRV